MNACDVMTTQKVWACAETSDAQSVAKMMLEHNIGAIPVLDREGRGRYNDTWVRSKIFPLRNDVTDEQVCLAMGWLYTRRMIIPYQSNGRSYFHVPSFPRYQGDTSKEAESYYPPPPDLDDDD